MKEPLNIEKVELSFSSDIKPILDKYRIKFGNYDKYSNAIQKRDKPKTFFPGLQYRLLNVDKNKLVFSQEKYNFFHKIDYGASLSYEAAKDFFKGRVSFGSNFKKIIKKLKKPSDYIILTGINTLTLLINKKNELRMIMHLRGKEETASASGTFHVIPSGEFQPACVAPVSWKDDFSILKNVMREYSEEIEDKEEYNGESGIPFDYNQEPFISLLKAKKEEKFKIFYLGTGLDAVSLQGEILTCSIFDEETFNTVFPKILKKNKEGIIITDKDRWGRSFDADLETYFDSNTLAAGETILKLVKNNIDFFINNIKH